LFSAYQAGLGKDVSDRREVTTALGTLEGSDLGFKVVVLPLQIIYVVL
jgi:hypothetical protein